MNEYQAGSNVPVASTCPAMTDLSRFAEHSAAGLVAGFTGSIELTILYHLFKLQLLIRQGSQ
jgi:hypothetical protein